jgi:hypothetical protein
MLRANVALSASDGLADSVFVFLQAVKAKIIVINNVIFFISFFLINKM